MRFFASVTLVAAVLLFLGASLSCEEPAKTVVLYTSVDEPIARQIIHRFQLRTGLKVELVTDAEATKTAGLASKVLAEKDHPRADVYWGNEPFHTIELADAGAFAPYASPTAKDLPARFKDPESRWHGAGYRVRLLVVSSRREDGAAVRDVAGIDRMTHPSLKNRIAIASPVTGTTSGHLAALYDLWGEEKFRGYMIGLRANGIKIVGGNSVVADMVGGGAMLAGFTDNDDANASITGGGQLKPVIPDQDENGMGTLASPPRSPSSKTRLTQRPPRSL